MTGEVSFHRRHQSRIIEVRHCTNVDGRLQLSPVFKRSKADCDGVKVDEVADEGRSDVMRGRKLC